jgi:NTP pyrophosphatase (non-canonical NTP hydrolase)
MTMPDSLRSELSRSRSGEETRITDAGPVARWGVRKCRDHWHLTSHGEDAMMEPFDTFEAANGYAERYNANPGDYIEPGSCERPSVPNTGTALSVREMQAINARRSARWMAGSPGWTTLEIAGELANVCKKLRRSEMGVPGNKVSDEELRRQARGEMADVMIVLMLTASKLGIDLQDAVSDTFNAKSEQMGFPERLSSAPSRGSESDEPSDDTRRLNVLMELLAADENGALGVVTLGWDDGECTVYAGDDGDFQKCVGIGPDLAAAIDSIEDDETGKPFTNEQLAQLRQSAFRIDAQNAKELVDAAPLVTESAGGQKP